MHSLNSHQQLSRLFRLHPKRIDLSLERIHRLLARLGHPERRLPPVVHVAGSNGKGSVIAYILAGLEATQQRVHVYTSPHLVRFHERICLASDQGAQPISEDGLTPLLQRCEQANNGAPITFFEITTAAAFLAFAENPADILLLETGLGGRLDATQTAEGRIMSVITPISLDHQEYLGDNLARIAKEKAGIITAGRPVFMGLQEAEAEQEIITHAEKLKAPLLRAGSDWHVRVNSNHMLFDIDDKRHMLPLPALAGLHQVDNAGIALAVLMHPPIGPLSREAMVCALTNAYWPGRLQLLNSQRLGLSTPLDIWIDGAHNPAAAEALSCFTWQSPPRLIFGMTAQRDPVCFLKKLVTTTEHVVTVPIPGQDCHSPESMAKAARTLGFKAESAPDIWTALALLAKQSHAPILITGSLYLIGHILQFYKE